MKDILSFWTSNYNNIGFWVNIIAIVILGLIIGVLICNYILNKKHRKKFHFNIEKCVLYVSFIGAVGCIVLSFFGEQSISIQILSFYVSFIFAWLLTKGSSHSEFKKMQHKVAKNTYRHIEVVETTVLITKKRVEKFCSNGNVSQGELQGIVDDLNSILTGIQSNKDDWKDMLKKSYREKISNQEDPEGKLEKLKFKPDSTEFKEIFKNEIKNNENPINENN